MVLTCSDRLKVHLALATYYCHYFVSTLSDRLKVHLTLIIEQHICFVSTLSGRLKVHLARVITTPLLCFNVEWPLEVVLGTAYRTTTQFCFNVEWPAWRFLWPRDKYTVLFQRWVTVWWCTWRWSHNNAIILFQALNQRCGETIWIWNKHLHTRPEHKKSSSNITSHDQKLINSWGRFFVQQHKYFLQYCSIYLAFLT